MSNQIMRVYYDTNGLPYKDSALTIHYPIIGSEFTGANNTSELHCYTSNISTNATWVANIRKADSTYVYRVLTEVVDSEGNTYQRLELDNEITSQKGHILIALNGYDGALITYDDDGNAVVNGNPTIHATGTINIAMNYAPIVIPLSEALTPTEYQQLLGAIATRLERKSAILLVDGHTQEALSVVNPTDGQVVYDKADSQFYKVSVSNGVYTTTQELVTLVSQAQKDSDGNEITTTYLKLSGGTMIGTLNMDGHDIEDIGSVSASTLSADVITVDDIMSHLNTDIGVSNNLVMASGKTIIVDEPTSDKQVANKGYVDTKVSTKQDTLTAGENIDITNNVVSAPSVTTKTYVDTKLETKANLVDGKIPQSELPSFVDDVLEYDTLSDFPTTGEKGKIYVAIDTNKTYRWSGSVYTEITSGTIYTAGENISISSSNEISVSGTTGTGESESSELGIGKGLEVVDGELRTTGEITDEVGNNETYNNTTIYGASKIYHTHTQVDDDEEKSFEYDLPLASGRLALEEEVTTLYCHKISVNNGNGTIYFYSTSDEDLTLSSNFMEKICSVENIMPTRFVNNMNNQTGFVFSGYDSVSSYGRIYFIDQSMPSLSGVNVKSFEIETITDDVVTQL